MGSHSNEVALELKELGLRSHLSEPAQQEGERTRRTKHWCTQIGVESGDSGADGYSGSGAIGWSDRLPISSSRGLRRIFVRECANVRKRLLIQVCGLNLGLLMRHLTELGAPRSLQSRAWMRFFPEFCHGLLGASQELTILEDLSYSTVGRRKPNAFTVIFLG